VLFATRPFHFITFYFKGLIWRNPVLRPVGTGWGLGASVAVVFVPAKKRFLFSVRHPDRVSSPNQASSQAGSAGGAEWEEKHLLWRIATGA
jgi:hypothetical protein